MTGKHTGLSEEEVLLAFAVEPIHNRETLEHYLGEYPEHANALVDCSIELMVDATRGDEVALTSEAVVDQAWQIFQTTIGQPAAVPYLLQQSGVFTQRRQHRPGDVDGLGEGNRRRGVGSQHGRQSSERALERTKRAPQRRLGFSIR